MLQQGYLKQGLRLNRSIGYSFVAYAVLIELLVPHVWVWHLRVAALVVLSVVSLLANEAALRLMKKFPQTEPMFLEKFSVLAPIVCFTLVSVGYLLSGQLGAALTLMVPILQALFYGHNRLAKILTAAMFGLYMVTFPFNYLQPLGAAPMNMFLQVTPFLLILFHYGLIICNTVRTTTSQLIRLQSLAATDGLTGLVNRRQFNHQLHSEIARARRHHLPLSLALFDIDNFKKLNDVYGHPVGDRILKELGALIAQNVRESDISARYGGEEFALILPETRLTEAVEILERLRILVEQTVFCMPDNPLPITISIGVSQLDFDHPTSFELVEKADAALYEAKRQGKNCVKFGILPTPKITFTTPRPVSS